MNSSFPEPQRKLRINFFHRCIRIPNPIYPLQLNRYLKHQISQQDKYDQLKLNNSTKAVVFILPGKQVISGGILSIFTICEFTRTILSDYQVLMVTEPGRFTYASLNWFSNQERIIRWELFINSFTNLSELIIHIPEYLSNSFFDNISPNDRTKLLKIPSLRINILNQNPQLMPNPKAIEPLFKLTKKITQTLAFKDKKIQELSNKYRMPITALLSYIDLTHWQPIPYELKSKRILLSPDINNYSKRILKLLKLELPEYEVEVIHRMTFEDYMRKVQDSFAVISLGEGYDGYLLQPAYVGTLSFAVYNDIFFPSKKFLRLRNVFSTYDQLLEDIVGRIVFFAAKKSNYYEAIEQLKEMDKDHSKEELMSRLNAYYQEVYDCYPNRS